MKDTSSHVEPIMMTQQKGFGRVMARARCVRAVRLNRTVKAMAALKE
jgi:hypothetical protein